MIRGQVKSWSVERAAPRARVLVRVWEEGAFAARPGRRAGALHRPRSARRRAVHRAGLRRAAHRGGARAALARGRAPRRASPHPSGSRALLIAPTAFSSSIRVRRSGVSEAVAGSQSTPTAPVASPTRCCALLATSSPSPADRARAPPHAAGGHAASAPGWLRGSLGAPWGARGRGVPRRGAGAPPIACACGPAGNRDAWLARLAMRCRRRRSSRAPSRRAPYWCAAATCGTCRRRQRLDRAGGRLAVVALAAGARPSAGARCLRRPRQQVVGAGATWQGGHARRHRPLDDEARGPAPRRHRVRQIWSVDWTAGSDDGAARLRPRAGDRLVGDGHAAKAAEISLRRTPRPGAPGRAAGGHRSRVAATCATAGA